MPTIEQPQSDSVIGPELSASPTLGAQIDLVTGFLQRRYRLILLGLLLALPFGALYLYITPPSYTASSIMMIEPRKGGLEALTGSSVPDAVWIESQSIALKSLNIANYVVKQLRLADDPQFVRSGVWWLDKLLFRLGWGEDPEPKTEPERVGAAIAALNNGLGIKRLGQSYMMQIDFRSQNGEQAARIANTVIDAYIFDQLNAKYQANRRSTDWLQERLQALREQAAAAERAAIEYRSKNNIVATGAGLMNEKELTEISGGLVSARAHASDVQVRLERVQAVRKAYQQERPNSGEQDETVPEAMASAIITPLRAKYLDLVNREADWSARYGKNHRAVVLLNNQIRDIRRSIGDELGRIEENLKSEYEIAKKRAEEFDKSQTKLISQSTETNQALVTYFSLDAAAKSYRRLYDNFLQRHTEAVQQQTFPITEARQISSASAVKTGPKTALVGLMTIVAGAMIGGGFAVLREIMDRKFRTREQVQSVLATECLALVPLVADNSKKRILSKPRRPLALEQRREERFDINGRVGARNICITPKIMQMIIDAPGCAYAEAIRAIKLTIDMNHQANAKIIGLTSSLPSEGKSTLAVAMATLIAQSGARVMLVDCDVRHSSISRLLAPDASTGLLDVVAGTVDLADAVWTDEATQLEFLPVGQSVANATEFLASKAAKSLFDTLQIKYDYVIVDLAPLVANMDVRSTSGFIDSYLLVVEWGSTKVDAVQYALRHAPSVHANMVGVVLNKVDMAVMGRYDSYGANYYYGQPPPQRARSVN
jgi:succinoglycan biosynthesis transport protein ExoP